MAFAYAPQYPPQVPDVSFGVPQAVTEMSLHALGDTARYYIPTSDELGLSWTETGFDDAAWPSGATGIGYSSRTEFAEVTGTDVKNAMKGIAQ